jgi:malate synthase
MLFKEIGITIDHTDTYPDILDRDAMKFLADLSRNFRTSLKGLLKDRFMRQISVDEGNVPCFDPETADIRESDWTVAKIPADILDRRVEITGPPDRKMVINALNSGANVFMADFEDSMSPTWENALLGQRNVRDAVNKSISYQHPTKGVYTLNEKTATLFVRPRGLHLEEAHFLVDGLPIPASLFDFGLYIFHNSRNLISQGTAPYFYLPKLEHYTEARWWNDVFNWSQDYLGVDKGTVRATVLLETLPAAFQMDEILYELREHSAGLNCGRWDYIFSYIKTFKDYEEKVTPDRDEVGMTTPFMDSYSKRVIQVCHRRRIHAMGGMAAQIPIRGNDEANKAAMEKVRKDKVREATAGHDGTWVAHPGLVGLAKEVFDEFMPTHNQINKDTNYIVEEEDLVATPQGSVTEAGLKKNIDVGVRYLAAWMSGNGCVPLYNVMEDAATAEISRAQVWQWVKHKKCLTQEDGGRVIDASFIGELVDSWKVSFGENGITNDAAELFRELSTTTNLAEFLTVPAYQYLINKRNLTQNE